MKRLSPSFPSLAALEKYSKPLVLFSGSEFPKKYRYPKPFSARVWFCAAAFSYHSTAAVVFFSVGAVAHFDVAAFVQQGLAAGELLSWSVGQSRGTPIISTATLYFEVPFIEQLKNLVLCTAYTVGS